MGGILGIIGVVGVGMGLGECLFLLLGWWGWGWYLVCVFLGCKLFLDFDLVSN